MHSTKLATDKNPLLTPWQTTYLSIPYPYVFKNNNTIMKQFTTLKTTIVPLNKDNIDTDQIIPAQFLSIADRENLGTRLFDGLKKIPEFILNQDTYKTGKVLVSKNNFGCGSSREHAAWALLDHGFEAVIAVSFGDIFKNNSQKNGLLLIEIPEETIDILIKKSEENAQTSIEIDLQNQSIQVTDEDSISFEIDAFKKSCLLRGVDDIGYILGFEDKITEHEKKTPNYESDTPQTMLDKIWKNHCVYQEEGSPTIFYIDRHLFHEVTSPQAFDVLRKKNLPLRRTDKTFGVVDHYIPTTDRDKPSPDKIAQEQIDTCEKNTKEFGVSFFDGTHKNQGIIHVCFPEIGVIHPGMTVVAGDSHTSTHGAFGAMAFGIGTSEVGHVFATQCLLQKKPKSYQVILEGTLKQDVTPKDIVLALIAKIGTGDGTGCAFEFTGPAAKDISMEGRMTICNMAIEGGARTGMFPPDEKTFTYLKDKEHAPKGEDWDKSVEEWKKLKSDEGAKHDHSVTINLNELEPMVTYGTNPGMGIKITENIPTLEEIENEEARKELTSALEYTKLTPGTPIIGTPIDYVFIGSCTNARIEDFRAAAEKLKGKKVAENVTALAVPGSYPIKNQAEKEGLDTIFKDAGFEWREPGCSMCLVMSPDRVPPGKRCASTSNRNFRGRQGPESITHLMSPVSAAAASITGYITDPREI